MGHLAGYWHRTEDGRVQCDLCPRECRLRPGQRGFCFVRANEDGQLVLTTYGRSSGFCIDPVEKKPLNHFLPGTQVFSFGTAGCNLACKYCQNWEISTSREMNLLAEEASPSQIARTAANWQCSSVAFTYNDPVIFAEYAIDTAVACRAAGLASIAVTAGYINPEARRDFFAVMDAANIDLKGFSDSFYQQVTGARLRPVLDTISYAVHETNVWVELTTLLLPGYNDASSDLREMCRWIVTELGPDVPLHFTAFHPDNRMRDLPRTPTRTLARARAIAQEEGLHYVYTGNIEDPDGQTTYCPNCKSPVIRRDRYTIDSYDLDAEGRCRVCGTQIPGRFGGSSVVDQSFRLPHRVAIR
ncbi:MAG: AmmeMemoRadiSam system radical SAM enzyme [Propionibacterium sp.]|uniref:AmmeMemoRadiSam system radical SAM enzyme n=1 Tax=Brooklawnia propionicigenes TaxID=3041175 RepID=UPI00169BC07C|nr:AmmeMemoRadiSam system radical SAM enzyme [Brooklawnia sp. SH051]NLI84601.1 AmmeMemoRadiSam system radical SAM enzyme [Propionibacterium sp.]